MRAIDRLVAHVGPVDRDAALGPEYRCAALPERGGRAVESIAAIGVDEDGVETRLGRRDELDRIAELDWMLDMEMTLGQRDDRWIVLDDGEGATGKIGREEAHHGAAAEAEKQHVSRFLHGRDGDRH